MKKLFFLGMIAALLAPATLRATILLNQGPVTWTGNDPQIKEFTLSQPMTQTDTYYMRYTVELTSTVQPGPDQNLNNTSYPYVPMKNASQGGAAFLFYIGQNYDNNYLASTGFSTSSWRSGTLATFSATDGGAQGSQNLTSTGMFAQYSSPSNVVKYQVDLTLRMGAKTYDYTVTQLDGSGAVVQQVTLSALDFGGGSGNNAWANFNTFSNVIKFQSSTSQMTAHFDSIIVSTEQIPVPEPGTFVLAGLGTALLCFSRRRRKA